MIQSMERSVRLCVCVLSLACLGAAGPAGAACLAESFELVLPRQIDTGKLAEQEHVLAAVLTPRGMLEARATLKQGALGPISFTLGGKPLKEVSRAQLPESAQQCLKQRRKDVLGENGATGAAEALLGWLIPSAEAYWFKGVGKGCKGKGPIVFTVVECFDEGGGRVCVLEVRQGGRVCGYAVV